MFAKKVVFFSCLTVHIGNIKKKLFIVFLKSLTCLFCITENAFQCLRTCLFTIHLKILETLFEELFQMLKNVGNHFHRRKLNLICIMTSGVLSLTFSWKT